MQQGAATLGPKGTILYCNPSLPVLLGMPIERVIGERCQSYVATEDAAKFEELLAKASDGCAECDVSLRSCDGALIPVSISANPLLVQGIRPTCLVITDLTERKARELELRKLSLALEQIAASVVITNTLGTIEYVNPRFCEITGRAAAELIGPAIRPDQPLPALFQRIDESMRSGLDWRGEFWDCPRSGLLIWVASSIWPLRDPEGQITHCVAILEDATPAYQANAIELLFHSVSQRILDGETIATMVSDSCEQLAEIFRLPLVLVCVRDQYRSGTVFFSGGPRSDSVQTLRKRDDDTADAKSSPALVRKLHVFDLDDPGSPPAPFARECGFRFEVLCPLSVKGEVTGEIGFYSERKDLTSPEVVIRLGDVAERLGGLLGRARDQQQLTLQGTALASVSNAVFITDQNGCIEWVNESFSRLSGYRLDEVIGQTPRVLKSGQQDESFYSDLWQTIRGGEVWRGDTCNRRRDGSLFSVTQTITPLRNSSGAISHFVAIHEDITLRKSAEARYEFIAAARRSDRPAEPICFSEIARRDHCPGQSDTGRCWR